MKPVNGPEGPLARVLRLRRLPVCDAAAIQTTPRKGARRTPRGGKEASGAGWSHPGEGRGDLGKNG